MYVCAENCHNNTYMLFTFVYGGNLSEDQGIVHKGRVLLCDAPFSFVGVLYVVWVNGK